MGQEAEDEAENKEKEVEVKVKEGGRGGGEVREANLELRVSKLKALELEGTLKPTALQVSNRRL